MSKHSEEEAEADLAVATEIEHINESLPLRTLSRGATDEDVNDFVDDYGLTNKLDVFCKAAQLLHKGEEQVLGITADETRALTREGTHRWRQPKMLYFTIFMCSLGAIEQGWAQTGMNGANLYIPEAFGLGPDSTRSSLIVGMINSGLYLAQGSFGAWLSEPFNSHVGRRGTVFIASALCLFGNLGSAFSFAWPMLVLFRLVLGTGLGLNTAQLNMFVAECAPAYIRGGLAVSWQMFTAFGILLGFISNVAFYDVGPILIWRYQLAAPFIPTIPLHGLIYFCCESPAWQIKRLQYDSAFVSLVRLRNTELQAACELYSGYLIDRSGSGRTKHGSTSFLTKFKSLFTIARNRNALCASYTVMLAQQLCGINIIAFYSSTIFTSSGFTALSALWASVVFGVINFLGAVPAIWTMDTFGRRRLMLWTLPAMAVTMGLASVSFMLPKGTPQFILTAGLIYLFCALYSPGVGPVPCAYSAEIYSLEVREVGMSFAVSTAATWATVLSVTFPMLLEKLGEQGSFGLYAGLNLLAWVLCWIFVRETKGLRLEQMDDVFEGSLRAFVREQWAQSTEVWRAKREVGGGWTKVGQTDDMD